MVSSFNKQLVLIFVLLIGLGKSFSLANRQVKEVNMVTITEKEYAAEADSKFSLQKKNVDAVTNTAETEKSGKTGGRKMTIETRKKTRKVNKVSMVSSATVENYVGNRKADHMTGEEENWKDDFMAFSADYRSAKSHPPKNN